LNIFTTSDDPKLCAQALDDLRLNKMILETAQMLCTAHHVVLGHGASLYLYKPTHVNHPCNIWARESIGNYGWLLDHFMYLGLEYEFRNNKKHASIVKLSRILVRLPPIEKIERTPFANCSPYKSAACVLLAYQQTMRDKWEADKRRPKWTKRGPPIFFHEELP